MSLQSQLRKLLDQATNQTGIDAVRDFINENPELNLNAITQNDLSALWWALTPPKGQPINEDLVRLLLPKVNVVQTYLEYTPRQYLTTLSQSDKVNRDQLIADILRYEDHYVAATLPQQQVKRTLADIANDAQNTHNALIVEYNNESIVRLYQRYGKNVNTPSTLKVMREELPRIFLTLVDPEAKLALDRIEKDNVKFAYTMPDNTIQELNQADILSLLWQAAHETDLALLCGGGNSPKDIAARKHAIWEALKEKRNHCWTGRTNQIVNALNAMHVDIKYKEDSLDLNLKLDDEQSRNKYLALLSQELTAIEASNKLQFNSLLQAILLDDPDDNAIKIKDGFIKRLSDAPFMNTLDDEKVNQHIIDEIKLQIEAKELPFTSTKILKPLVSLQNLYGLIKEDLQFNNCILNAKELSLESTIQSASDAFPINKLYNWHSTIQDYANQLNEVERYNLYKTIQIDYMQTESHPNLQEIILKHTWLHYIKHHQSIYLSWYQALPFDIQKLFIQSINLSLKQPINSGDVINFAMEKGYFHGLDFKALDLKTADLRGIDLSGFDLSGISLESADCRLITYNQDTSFTNTNMENSLVSIHFVPVLLAKIQTNIARTGKSNDKDIELANALLDNPSINLTLNDINGVSGIKRILGQNNADASKYKHLICMPPIVQLVNHRTVKQHSSPPERAVKTSSLFFYRRVIEIALMITVLGAISTGVILFLLLTLTTVLSLGSIIGLAILGLGMLALITATFIGVPKGMLREPTAQDYHYISTHHHPFVITAKPFLQIIQAAKFVASIFSFNRKSKDQDYEAASQNLPATSSTARVMQRIPSQVNSTIEEPNESTYLLGKTASIPLKTAPPHDSLPSPQPMVRANALAY